MTPTTTWKSIERKLAALFDGRRVPSSGNGAIKGDVVQMRALPNALLEVKHGKQVPKTIEKWLAEAEGDAVKAGIRHGILAMHYPRQPIGRSLLVLRADSLRALVDAAVYRGRDSMMNQLLPPDTGRVGEPQ